MKLAAIALAAGLSRRMGPENKLLLLLAGKPLFSYTLRLLRADCFFSRVVVTNTPAIGRAAAAAGFLVAASPDSEQGLAKSLQAGIAAAGAADGWIFFNCDQPQLTEKEVGPLVQAFFSSNQIVVPLIKGRPASPCIFPARFKSELMALPGDEGGRAVYKNHPSEVCFLSFDDKAAFADVDTMADWLALSNDITEKQKKSLNREGGTALVHDS